MLVFFRRLLRSEITLGSKTASLSVSKHDFREAETKGGASKTYIEYSPAIENEIPLTNSSTSSIPRLYSSALATSPWYLPRGSIVLENLSDLLMTTAS
jgi:hypothetical protein